MKALISVANKTGLIELAKYLSSINVELISAGGSYNILKNSGLPVTNVLSITSFSKPLYNIIKTLYPEIYAGISADRDDFKQMDQLKKANIDEIDFVIVNLYPFDKVIADPNITISEKLKLIYIGGPTMLRSAAKSYKNIVVISDPSDYSLIIDELRCNNQISIKTRKYLMKKVFKVTSEYDTLISNFLFDFL